MRRTITIPDELYDKFLAYCREADLPVSTKIADLIQDFLLAEQLLEAPLKHYVRDKRYQPRRT